MISRLYKNAGRWDKISIIASLIFGVFWFFVQIGLSYTKSHNVFFSCGKVETFSFGWFHSWVLLTLYTLTMSVITFAGSAVSLFLVAHFVPRAVVSALDSLSKANLLYVFRRKARPDTKPLVNVLRVLSKTFYTPKAPSVAPIGATYRFILSVRDAIYPILAIGLCAGFFSITCVMSSKNTCLVQGPQGFYVASMAFPTILFALFIVATTGAGKLNKRLSAFVRSYILSRMFRCSVSDAEALSEEGFRHNIPWPSIYAPPGENLSTGRTIVIHRPLFKLSYPERRIINSMDEDSHILDRLDALNRESKGFARCIEELEAKHKLKAIVSSHFGLIEIIPLEEEAPNAFVPPLVIYGAAGALYIKVTRSPTDLDFYPYQLPIVELLGLKEGGQVSLKLSGKHSNYDVLDFGLGLYRALRDQMILNADGTYTLNASVTDLVNNA